MARWTRRTRCQSRPVARRSRGDGIAPPVRRVRRPRAGDAARRARQHDRLDGAPDDRRRARRLPAVVLGRDRLPAGADDRDAAVREARRPVRAQDRAAGRSRGVPDRLGPLRARAEHAGADRVSRHPGTRRRRADGLGAGGDRGRRAAARPRPLPGHLRRGVRPLERGRAADRRLLHHAPVLAVDLLHQHPARDRRIRRARIHPAVGDEAGASRDRLPGHRAARRGAQRDRAADDARWLGRTRGARRRSSGSA